MIKKKCARLRALGTMTGDYLELQMCAMSLKIRTLKVDAAAGSGKFALVTERLFKRYLRSFKRETRIIS